MPETAAIAQAVANLVLFATQSLQPTLKTPMSDASSASVSPAQGQILLLGMHRSGTSATARVLGLMGAWIGEAAELLPPHPKDNPTGYWERIDVVVANEELLRGNGYDWDHVAGFDAGHVDAETLSTLHGRINTILDHMKAVSSPWLIKDPRLCLLLPLWRSQLADPKAVVVVRDPRAIARSLLDTHRGVYTSHFLLALWEKYMHCMLADLRGQQVLFVDHAQLLADPHAEAVRLLEGLQALGIDGLHPAADSELDAFIDKRLNRSTPVPHMSLSASQQALQDWLLAQTRIPGPVLVENFPLHSGSDENLAEYGRMVDFERSNGQNDALRIVERRLARIEAELKHEQRTLREEQQHLHAQLHQANNTAQLLQQQLHTSKFERDDFELSLKEVANCNQTLRQQIASLGEHAHNVEVSIAALRNSLSWRLSAPLRVLGKAPTLKLPMALEQRLYKAYYAIPGLNSSRKAAMIRWMHTYTPWLTRNTLSYQIHQRTQQYVNRRQLDAAERERRQRMDGTRAKAVIAGLARTPLISIAMPVYNVERSMLMAAVDSVRNQFYPHWELCIADDASTLGETREVLDELKALGDPRIKIQRLAENQGIAGASNVALELASGEHVGLLDNDDALTRDALLEAACRIVKDDADLIYSDEDKLDEAGAHVTPHFKPDFSPDYLSSNNYICHFSVIRRSLLQKIGGFRPGFDGAQDYDLILRASENTQNIVHIPKVLYHWRMSASSTAADASAKPETTAAGHKALTESLARRGIAGVVDPGPHPNTFRVRRDILGEPLVSIIIPFRDKPELLQACVTSVLDKTTYANFEIIGIDNGSEDATTLKLMRELEKRDARVRFIHHDVPFNYSAINNFAASQAHGEHLLLLNNDTEVISGEWLSAMLEHAQRPEVGVVGAKLLYGSGTVQHAGVIIGQGGIAGHSHLNLPGDHPGYFARPQLIQNLSAVTFACAMVRREVFEELGGLNDSDLCIAFNDVDFCLRAREAGYLVVYTPYALLYHHESISRGFEDNPEKLARFHAEIHYMEERHGGLLQKGDPYYNPNLCLTESFQPRLDYADDLPL